MLLLFLETDWSFFMSKAEATKKHITEQAAILFNQKGYAGVSIADVMQATGLKKGGIYNHFKSKDELAVAAFNFAVTLVINRYQKALRGQRNSILRLKTLINTFCTVIDEPICKGGCPLLNTAVESDDNHPILRQCVQKAMDGWREMITKIINIGIKHKEISRAVDADVSATVIISTLEGALMMTKLYDHTIHLQRLKDHLFQYVESLSFKY